MSSEFGFSSVKEVDASIDIHCNITRCWHKDKGAIAELL